jgi:Zn-dependent metalloprotease
MIKLLQKKLILPALFCLQGIATLNAQATKQEIAGNLTKDSRVSEFSMEALRGTPSLIKMKTSGATLSLSDTPAFLQSILGFGQATTFVQKGTSTAVAGGMLVDKFQQYNNGIKVEHGVFKVISKKNIVQAFTAEFYNLASIASTPVLSESAALQKAFNFVGATSYAWDYIATLGNSPEHIAAYNELYPKGELVMVDDYQTEAVDISLAYKFNVYAAEPLSRADIYVDATSGKILLNDAIIKHIDANGKDEIAKAIKPTARKVNTAYEVSMASPLNLNAIGDTRYAGRRFFNTSLNANGFYELKGTSPTGIPNETFSYEGIGGAPVSAPISGLAVSIFDGDTELLGTPEVADNKWDAVEHRKDSFVGLGNAYPAKNEKNNDDVALDAHWGAEIVLGYWSAIHKRESYDNKGTKILNYVHYGDAYDNAFWNGSAMTYGDGSYQGGTNPKAGSFGPLTSMDVCSHEIGHGVCEFTADLVYAKESGGMNEGFSDIWAASVENYVLTQIDNSLPYIPFGIGEQIDERDKGLLPGDAKARALRWMDDPNAAGDPESYGGKNWVPVTGPDCVSPNTANDQCGVHSNSGVLNKWYYLMVAGSGKTFSPGLSKKEIDDEVTDAGNPYKVEALGFGIADQVTYLGETMLTPNATFADMRNASILASQLVYGVGSIAEQQVTNAWHAVDVGPVYDAGVPNTITFSDSNPQIYTESNEINGCNDINTYTVSFLSALLPSDKTVAINVTGTALKGTDFTISKEIVTFPAGSSVQTLAIDVKDDAIIEPNETIILSYTYNNGTADVTVTKEFTIIDDDFIPKTGKTALVLLDEKFDVSGTPTGWETRNFSTDPLSNIWKFNGIENASKKAYISDGVTNVATYNTNIGSNTILLSPLLNAAGATGVTVSFDWEAGGETDPPGSEGVLDYGEFVYSTDGTSFIGLEKFHGSIAGTVSNTGVYSADLNIVDGLSFYVGWRWTNDTNVGGPFSFAIDNVKVTAIPAGIETKSYVRQTEESIRTNTVNKGDTVNFLSAQDGGLMVKIENASADLGCVTISVVEEGTSAITFSKLGSKRAAKVYRIDTDNTNATYDLTVYYTNEELKDFTDPSALKPVKVISSNIDDATFSPNNFTFNGVLAEENSDGEWKSYTGQFTGPGVVSIGQQPTLSTEFPSITDAAYNTKVYPNPVVSSLTIEIADSTIKSVAIYNILGKTMKVMNMEAANKQATITVSDFAKGLYVLKISTADGQVLTESFFKE